MIINIILIIIFNLFENLWNQTNKINFKKLSNDNKILNNDNKILNKDNKILNKDNEYYLERNIIGVEYMLSRGMFVYILFINYLSTILF